MDFSDSFSFLGPCVPDFDMRRNQEMIIVGNHTASAKYPGMCLTKATCNILNYFPDLSFPRGRPLTVEGVGWGDVFFPKNLNILRTDLEDNAKK